MTTIIATPAAPPKPSRLHDAVHLAVLVLGALVAVLSVTKTGVGGTDASVGTSSGALLALGSLVSWAVSNNKALAAFVDREIAWGQAHAPALEAALGEAQSAVAAVPALQGAVADVRAQVDDLSGKVSAATGVDVDAIAEAVKAKVVASLTAGPVVAQPAPPAA